MSAKFTPGPWHFDGEYVWADAIQGYVAYPDTEDLRSGESVPLRQADEMIRANGALIAAAPEILEALRDILAGWKYIRSFHGDLYGVGWDRAQEKAEAALFKATGERL